MLSIGITGGVASGKTTVARMVADRLDVFAFSADAMVGELLQRDVRVHQALTQRYGATMVMEAGVDRARLRETVFGSPEERRYLESILHPLVREVWRACQERERQARRTFFVVEIPLLFETKAQEHLDVVLCVASSPSVQMSRLVTKRGLSQDVAGGILTAQWSNEQRVSQSNLVIWNDGDLPALVHQTSLACGRFLDRDHGGYPLPSS